MPNNSRRGETTPARGISAPLRAPARGKRKQDSVRIGRTR